MSIEIRPVEPKDTEQWIRLRVLLWPEIHAETLRSEAHEFLARGRTQTTDVAFVADDGAIVGFLEVLIRPFSDGCDSMPVPHVEGWYVSESHRRTGIGLRLLDAAIAWCRDRGFSELASDTQPQNEASVRAHAACGFEEVDRLIKFRRKL